MIRVQFTEVSTSNVQYLTGQDGNMPTRTETWTQLPDPPKQNHENLNQALVALIKYWNMLSLNVLHYIMLTNRRNGDYGAHFQIVSPVSVFTWQVIEVVQSPNPAYFHTCSQSLHKLGLIVGFKNMQKLLGAAPQLSGQPQVRLPSKFRNLQKKIQITVCFHPLQFLWELGFGSLR